MSTESILSLILRLRKQGGGDKEVAEALDKLKKKSEETKGAFGGLSTGMADVKATFDLAAQAWGAAAKVLDVTVVAAANWGDEMGDLAQLTGTGVKATSEFAATMELLGIKSGDLTKTIKAFTSQGLQPTMENIKRLAADYQAIQDPVEKNAFLFKNFGKQAGDVAEVLGKSTEELEAFTEAARTSGKVIDEETAEAAEKLNIQLAKLQQRAEGFGIAVGNFVIPSVVGLFEGFDQLTAAAQSGEVSWLEYANRLAAVATGHGTAATLTAGLTDKTIELTDETEALREANRLLGETTQTATLILGDWTTAQEDADIAAWGLADAMDNENRIAAGLSAGLGELTKQTLFNQAAAGLDSLAALDLARSMGLIDEEAYAAGTAVEDLRQKYDTNHDGAITAAEGAAQFAREAANLARELNLIPTNISTTISVTKVGDENFGGWTAPAGSGKPPAVGLEEGVKIGGANGLDMIVPPGYPNDSFPVWAQSGERVTITPAGQTTNMGGVTIVVQGVTDPEANARAMARILAAQARGLTQSGAALMGG